MTEKLLYDPYNRRDAVSIKYRGGNAGKDAAEAHHPGSTIIDSDELRRVAARACEREYRNKDHPDYEELARIYVGAFMRSYADETDHLDSVSRTSGVGPKVPPRTTLKITGARQAEDAAIIYEAEFIDPVRMKSPVLWEITVDVRA
jgi:hypothetical protein